MATLMEVRNGGEVVGRCDERCYDAAEPKCECICNGRNHGVGLKNASANTENLSERMIKRYVERKQLSDRKYAATVFGEDAAQTSMLALISRSA